MATCGAHPQCRKMMRFAKDHYRLRRNFAKNHIVSVAVQLGKVADMIAAYDMTNYSNHFMKSTSGTQTGKSG